MFDFPEERNKEIIYDLVKNHFSLDTESLEYFKEKLYKPDLLSPYDDIFKDSSDHRIYWELPSNEENDVNWKEFKSVFFPITKMISYENFITNKVKVGKEYIRLNKFIIKKVFDKEFEEDRREIFIKAVYPHFNEEEYNRKDIDSLKKELNEYISSYTRNKTSNKNKLYLVLSKNFTDWFLCSTDNGWSSCLSMNSEYLFGSGLPGLVGDKNRAMLYITDGFTKNYRGIINHIIKKRSWVLLDNEDTLRLVKFYPDRLEFPINVIDKITNLNFKYLESYESKYSITPLFFTNDNNCFIYQDNTKFVWNEKELKIETGNTSGVYMFSKGNKSISIDDPFESDVTTIDRIISNNKELTDFSADAPLICQECGDRITSGYEYINDYGELFCEHCFTNLYIYCKDCDEPIFKKDAFIDDDGYLYCEYCFAENFITCEYCECNVRIDVDVIYETYEGKVICLDCIEKKNLVQCDECDIYFEFDDLNAGSICKSCLNKLVDKKQNKFEFEKAV